MLRRFLFLSVGALALLVVLGAPGQLHAQRMRGSSPRMVHPNLRGGFRPGFQGRFNPGFNRRMFDPRFNRGMFDPRFNRGMFDPRFNRGFFDPRFSPGFSPGFFRSF
ncbi:MAG TPA: hypothetical protein VEL76_11180 [Gemmataceae bacterium]|nr:hypothetical protein [Gemmataceae bacterium]